MQIGDILLFVMNSVWIIKGTFRVPNNNFLAI